MFHQPLLSLLQPKSIMVVQIVNAQKKPIAVVILQMVVDVRAKPALAATIVNVKIALANLNVISALNLHITNEGSSLQNI